MIHEKLYFACYASNLKDNNPGHAKQNDYTFETEFAEKVQNRYKTVPTTLIQRKMGRILDISEGKRKSLNFYCRNFLNENNKNDDISVMSRRFPKRMTITLIHTHANTHTHICIYTHIYIHIYIYVYTYIYTYLSGISIVLVQNNGELVRELFESIVKKKSINL
jgi:hypothetical protein